MQAPLYFFFYGGLEAFYIAHGHINLIRNYLLLYMAFLKRLLHLDRLHRVGKFKCVMLYTWNYYHISINQSINQSIMFIPTRSRYHVQYKC